MGIRISIDLRDTAAESVASARGFDLIKPPARLLREFGLPVQERGYAEALWGVCANHFGRPPDWFFATETPSGPPWNRDHEGDWDDYPGGFYSDIGDWVHFLPRVEKRAVAAKITEISSKPDTFATREYAQPSKYGRGEFQVSLAKRVGIENSLTTSHEWSADIEATIGVEIGGEAVGHKVSASTTVSFGYAYGRQKTATRHTEHEVQDSLSAHFVEGAPPEAVLLASLMGSSGSVKVAVDYEYRLVGDACFWFEQRLLNGRKAHRLPLATIVADLGGENLRHDTEIVDLGFVSDGKVVLSDYGEVK